MLLIPSASAGWGATVEGSIIDYRLDSFTQDRDNPATGNLFSRTITTTPMHDYEIASSTGIIVMRYTVKFSSSSTGIYAFQASWDGVNIPDCMWAVETTNQVITATNLFPHLVVVCELTAAQLTGSHTFVITRSTQSGTPATLDHELISYEITRTDYLEPATMNDLTEFFNLIAPLLFFVVLTIWAERTKEPLMYVVAILAGIFAITTLWTEVETLRILLLAVVALVAWLGLEAGMKKERETQEQ